MQWIGPDNVSREIFDFDPASLIPSHLPGEDVEKVSATDKIKRARIFADNLRFFIMPGSMHELMQMIMKLGLIQLKKAGVKISSQTLAEAWAVPNYGQLDGSTEMEKWKSEQEMDLEFAARMMAIKAALGGGGGDQGGGAGGAGGAPKPPPGGPEGRPNADTAPPRLEQKDQGTRSTIATSR
jgi:hypothetical protein